MYRAPTQSSPKFTDNTFLSNCVAIGSSVSVQTRCGKQINRHWICSVRIPGFGSKKPFANGELKGLLDSSGIRLNVRKNQVVILSNKNSGKKYYLLIFAFDEESMIKIVNSLYETAVKILHSKSGMRNIKCLSRLNCYVFHIFYTVLYCVWFC